MRNRTRKVERDLELPPCDMAQADGVPCTAVGRRCEICERAREDARAREQARKGPAARRSS
jgi:hypothetical protein